MFAHVTKIFHTPGFGGFFYDAKNVGFKTTNTAHVLSFIKSKLFKTEIGDGQEKPDQYISSVNLFFLMMNEYFSLVVLSF